MSYRRRLFILIAGGSLLIAAALGGRAAKLHIERRYLDAALDIIQRHSIKRGEIDWKRWRTDAYDRSPDALTRAETHDTLRFVLAALGDRHSGFFTPEMVTKLNGLSAADNPAPDGQVIAGRFGYVRVPTFMSLNQLAIDRAAARLRRVVRAVDTQHPCGWVVDLRNNSGGNMWPMLAGLGPLLGSGSLGAFVDPDGTTTSWIYEAGMAAEAQEPRARVLDGDDGFTAADTSVAVLINRRTASSGEAVAVALSGRPRTRLFGQPTRGLTTSNRQFVLSDRAMINLAVATFADRTGRAYPSGIQPHEITEVTADDQVPVAATVWLGQQSACQMQ